MLIAVTCVIAGGALVLGFLQKKSFNNNTNDYQANSANLRKVKSMAGYPSQETVDKMSASLADYEATLDGLSKEFATVTIPEFKNVTPAEFSAKATGILLYNLEALVWLHEELLKHDPDALLNLYRKPVGLEVEGGESAVSNESSNSEDERCNVVKLPIELTF